MFQHVFVFCVCFRKGWLPFKELYEQSSPEHEVSDLPSSMKLLHHQLSKTTNTHKDKKKRSRKIKAVWFNTFLIQVDSFILFYFV